MPISECTAAHEGSTEAVIPEKSICVGGEGGIYIYFYIYKPVILTKILTRHDCI